jgi:hypothetical protein
MPMRWPYDALYTLLLYHLYHLCNGNTVNPSINQYPIQIKTKNRLPIFHPKPTSGGPPSLPAGGMHADLKALVFFFWGHLHLRLLGGRRAYNSAPASGC